jgi:hypothetical protein
MRTLLEFGLDSDIEIVNEPLGDDNLSNQSSNDED